MPRRSTHSFMQRGAPAVFAAALLLALAPAALAQREAPGSVAGRVTDGERGVAGVTVALVSNDPAQRFRTVTRARTDADGRFLIQNVQPGRYQVVPFAPAFVVEGMANQYPPGRPLVLLAGEDVRDLDFRVERGGVITGRVTDADGNPLVGEAVAITPVAPGTATVLNSFDQRDRLMTDDRGVYRVYGLPPGSYRVSVGQGREETGAVSYGRRKIFQRTYYPNTTEQAQARVIELKAGEVAEDVDISLGRPLKTYRASGRFVMADTGQPVPNISFGYGTLDAAGRRVGAFGGGQATDARGEFQTEGFTPGRYTVFNMSGFETTEFYSEPTTFQIVDSDVTGLVVRVKRGASVSGFVVVEGMSDRAAVARVLPQMRVYGFVEARGQAAPPNAARAPAVGADGSFTLTGLRPGRLRISLSTEGAKGLSFSRAELNGANVTNGLDVTEGAQVTGVRLFVSYGSGVVLGQTSFLNGTPPPGSRAIAQARRAGVAPGANPREVTRTVEVDARGLFRIEGLPAGDYEITVTVFGTGGLRRSEPLSVSVSDGGETRVAPVVDFSKAAR